MELQLIQNKIYEIRGNRIMLDFDLAEMYETETRSLKQAVRRNLERFPEDFMFQLSKEGWIKLSESYNFFINTTNFDNMPVSVIEAMALGLCVVSTNVGGLPYLISDGNDGVLVPPNNCASFVNAIKKATQNPSQMKEMTLQARNKVEAFDWQFIKLRWQEVLQ